MCDAVIMCVCMCVYVLYLCNVRVSLRTSIFSTTPIRIVYHGMIASRNAFLSGFSERLFNFKEWCVEESDTRIHIFTHMHEKAKEKR